jgi:phosphotriesterase-related protein
MGRTYAHEHLIWSVPPPYDGRDPDLRLDSVEAAVKELTFFKLAGGHSLVEMTTPEVRRAPREMKAISQATGVHIIAATGHHKGLYSDAYTANVPVDTIAGRMLHDVMEGMDDTDIRAGVIKIGTGEGGPTENEIKVIRAAGIAHRETGVPVSTHTEAGTLALEQIRLLREAGVVPERMLIGHLDRRLNWDYHLQIARAGVYMGFDQISKEKYYPDRERIAFIKRLIEAGHGQQILLSGDLARKSNWPSYGFGNGPGLTYILWCFVPRMLEAGISPQAVDDLLIHNPARFFAF